MTPPFLQAASAAIIFGTCVVTVALVLAALVLGREGWAYPVRTTLCVAFFLALLCGALDDTCPAVFCGVRFMPDGIASLLLTFVAPLVVTTGLLLWPGGSFLTRLVDELPLAWLTWPQVFRSIGGLFLIFWAYGDLPGGFALPAGIGDLLVGFTAPRAVAWARQPVENRRLLLVWNALGILDFVVAVSTGFALDAARQYPLAVIPGFLVPFALLMHFGSLRKLRVRSLAAWTSAESLSTRTKAVNTL